VNAVYEHTPVLLDEVVAALAPSAGEVFVDATLGGGGHTRALLEAAACRVIGIDRDADAIEAATDALTDLSDRFTAVRGRFSALADLLDDLGIDRVDGILADVGVSSHQLDVADRGFSFRASGPVDMRMDQDAALSAADVVNHWPEARLADCIHHYGEERRARRVARAIVAGRPWSDTRALAEAVGAAVGGSGKRRRIHPATRTFQAIRIAVNDELDELRALLDASIHRLQPNGRLAIISFHSLEDRIVKRFLAEHSGRTQPRDPYGHPVGPVHFEVFPAVVPSSDDPNPRARSARLRSARRLPWNAQ